MLPRTLHPNQVGTSQLTCAAFHRQCSLNELPLVDLLVTLALLSLRGCVVLLFDILLFLIIFVLLLVLLAFLIVI